MSRRNIPYFLWDYKLSTKEIKRIIKGNDEYSRSWLAARILESAKFNDVWKFFKLSELVKIFPKLPLKKEVRKAWQKAFEAWGVSSS